MSGTRSLFRRAPAINPSAIIVSHGQPSNPEPAEAELANVARQTAKHLPGWNLFSATLAAPNALAGALAKAGPAPLIYPLFMTDGWFIQTMLPKRIGSSAAYIMPPMGTDIALQDLAADWLNKELCQAGWRANDTKLIIAAHGSGQSRNAARATNRFSQALANRIRFKEMRTGFIEEQPHLENVAQGAAARSICLPFFAASGDHVQHDIPQALDRAGFTGLRLDSIGNHPAIPKIIACALEAQMQRKVSA